MAMNKKEQANLNGAIKQEALLTALLMGPVKEPEPLPAPEGGSGRVDHGWDYNLVTGWDSSIKIREVWRKSYANYDNPQMRNGSQGPGRCYASREDALLAAYYELMRKTSVVALKIRKMMEQKEIDYL